jgi:N-acetylmuramoyl-L-alanine amidase
MATRSILLRLLVLGVVLALALPAAAQGTTAPRAAYQRLLSKERSLTAGGRTPSATQVRALVQQYEAFAGRYPRSGYSDNALWQAGQLSRMLADRLRKDGDRKTAVRLFDMLVREYPTSSLVPEARQAQKALAAPPPRQARATAKAPPTTSATKAPAPVPSRPAVAESEPETPPAPPASVPAPAEREPAPPDAGAVEKRPTGATLIDVRRVALPELVRVTFELSEEVKYRDERIDGPPRVFFDFVDAAPADALEDATLTFAEDVVRQIRVGRRPNRTTRVVLDLDGAERYSVFTLYNPYRLVIDVFRRPGFRPALPAAPVPPTDPALERTVTAPSTLPASAPSSTVPLAPTTPPTAASIPAPEAPATTGNGTFSLARQLGLGVSRIVIDPGHGGHDPGALGNKITEADLVLDVALRLEKLLRVTPGFDVVMTRRSDVFVPLEERTAMANRSKADLFLSIHANASRNREARGIETYFLNFASNPEAEAVAARENAASGRTMRHLPDIVRAIALNNKLDESRELARIVQTSLVGALRGEETALRDLGVKQAPFVVLIGAGMPSVLAEISFITNPRDAQLLRTGTYRQRVAQSLFDAITKYQRALKTADRMVSQMPAAPLAGVVDGQR